MLNPISKSGLIDSVVELSEKVYDLQVGQRMLADVHTKKAEYFIVNYFSEDVESLINLSKVNWDDAYNYGSDIADQAKWDRSHEYLIKVSDSMVTRVRLPDFNVKIPKRENHSRMYRSGWSVLLFLMLSVAVWCLKDTGYWTMLYEPRKRFAVCLAGQFLLIWALVAMMIPTGKNKKLVGVIITLATLFSGVMGLLD